MLWEQDVKNSATFTEFGGAEIFIISGYKAVIELQAVSYRRAETTNERPIQICAVATQVLDESLLKKIATADILVTLRNEEGLIWSLKIVDCLLPEEEITMEKAFHMIGRDIT